MTERGLAPGVVVSYHERGFRVARVRQVGRKWIHLVDPVGRCLKRRPEELVVYVPAQAGEGVQT